MKYKLGIYRNTNMKILYTITYNFLSIINLLSGVSACTKNDGGFNLVN